jgi:NAD(P)-dependent dehydrogenase (short-subunit alcohol dehydrogenase family)
LATQAAACILPRGDRQDKESPVQELLAGRIALVTGGARGIGRAIVGGFAAHGARGLVLDTDAAIASAELPPQFVPHVADVTRESDIAGAVAAVVAQFGRLDVVVANAGIVPPWHDTADLDFAEWERVFAVNARGVAMTIKHAVPPMQAAGGAIVVTASINVVVAQARQLAYTASKHAVLGIVRCAALDLGRYGIRVNAVAPGPVLTEALRERIRNRQMSGGPSEEESARELAAQTPLRRIATEADIANGVLFLASDLASAITGHMLPIDAGLA